MTEAKKNQILKKIDRLKKALRKEKATYGAHHDGAGYRYSIAEYYFELADYKKTNRYLGWFNKTFPNDGKYLYFDLGVAVTKYELGKIKEAKVSTIDLNRHNTYFIDLLIGNRVNDQNKYEWMDAESLSWAKEQVKEYKDLTTDNYLQWLGAYRKEVQYEKWYHQFIAIKRLIKGLDVGEERTNLLDAGRKCLQDWKDEVIL